MGVQDTIKNQIHQTALYQRFDAYRWREREVSYGSDYPDKTFYVIRRHANRAGLFSFVMTNLASIAYAIDQGWVPVIDMQNSANPMLSPELVGKENAWEYYFEQPCGYSLQDIVHARHVVLSSVTAPANYPEFESLLDAQKAHDWRLIAARYLHVREEHVQAARRYMETHFHGDPYLGVLCRGTDYLALQPSGHPLQPATEDVIADCRRLMQERELEYLYLATEDQNIWERFESAFPGEVYSYQQMHYSVSGDQNINDVANRNGNARDRNCDYLISILILAQADYVLAGAANGSYGARLLRKNDDNFCFYNLGLYP